MFNLMEIKSFSDRNVLQYFDAPDLIRTYSYADLYRESVELSRSMRCFLRKSSSRLQRINVGISLPIHCAALIPAIVG